MDGPDSSNSDLPIHMLLKVDNEAKIDPPIQTEYFLSGGATTLIFADVGANSDNSLLTRSAIPTNPR